MQLMQLFFFANAFHFQTKYRPVQDNWHRAGLSCRLLLRLRQEQVCGDQSECSNMTIDLSQMGVHLKNKKQYVGGLKHRAPGP